ncbi:hypothetical protein RhiirA1_533609 [Rhizophagus irregularis]|uniref:Uncharacterized protein n=1 Tax=Rhizophagus irregularis TaxID=588596 RepID=A0A2N0S0W5_9GLOM|nr:hypothetical protein RhiirA1_533609 [Rhizophagus irregularis]
MVIVSHWNEWYQIEVRDWQFLEPGEAKTTIDSHHAAISHSIKRYIRIGYDIRDGEDIVEVAKHLSGTSLANLEPNRSQFGPEDENSNNVSKKELNTKPNNNFSPSAIANLCTKPIVHPHPKISEQTESESSWTIPLLDINSTSIPGFMDNNNSSDELEDVSFVDANFQFSMGWALKSNQKLGGKGKGKRMKKKVWMDFRRTEKGEPLRFVSSGGFLSFQGTEKTKDSVLGSLEKVEPRFVSTSTNLGLVFQVDSDKQKKPKIRNFGGFPKDQDS